MFELRKYEPSDALEIKGRTNEKAADKLDDFDRAAESHAVCGPAFTGVLDGRIVGCGGVTLKHAGVGEAWMLCVDDIEQLGSIDPKRARDLLYLMTDEYKLHRLQAPIRADFPAGVSYARWIGFEYEATLKQYHPDKCDALMHVILRK